MHLTGDITVHKSDNRTRSCDGVKVLNNGGLAVWDEIEVNEFSFGASIPGEGFHLIDDRTKEVIEPDIVVGEEKWERIERDECSWKKHSTSNIMQRAKERDDVDEEKVKEQL